MSALARTSR